jgi:hypothetical protein
MKTMPLSPVDYIFTGVGSQPITFAFSYQNRIDPNVLLKSLDETLDHFPILRSQLNKISENDYEFQISEDGLIFDVVESDLAFEESKSISQYISPVSSVEEKPLTRITLTQTPKGSILAVSISHALVDGFSYFHFLSSWARIARGDSIIKPYLDRSIFLKSSDYRAKKITADSIYTDCGLFYGERRSKLQTGPINEEHIFMAAETIRSCIEDVKQEPNVSLTENDVITAYIWKKYIPEWNKENDNPKTYVTCPFDFRRIMTDFPKNYFGCALCFATASIDFQELLKASLGELAILIRNSVSRIKNDYILNYLNTLEGLRKQQGLAAREEVHLRHPHHGLIVTNLTRLPVRDIDFGFGAPVDFLTYAEVLASAAILPAEKGVEILVINPPETLNLGT